MDLKRLRVLTVVGPITFIVALEIVSVVVLQPLLGNNAVARLLVVFGILALATVPFSLWVFAVIERQQRDLARSAELLGALNTELEAKVAERTRQIERYSKELTTRVLQAQEEERKRIARELHDETAQSLSTLLINLDLLEPSLSAYGNGVPSGYCAGIERVRALTKRMLDNVRALSHDLRPTILDDFGLVAALHWFADEFKQTFGMPVEVEIEGELPGRLASEVELALFRIAQEALTNSGKYAEASCTRLSLSFPAGTARLVVEDNGKGFDPERTAGATRQGGLGLYGMQERADLLGATFELDAAPGQGTRVTVVAPISVAEHDVTGQGAGV